MTKKSSLVISCAQAKEFDAKAQGSFGMPVVLLMENAGRAVMEEAVKRLKNKNKIVILCGKGNNGGDGFVAARHLLTLGKKPEVFLAGKISDVLSAARLNLEILRKLKVKIQEISEKNLAAVKSRILKSDFIIDALLGVGLKGEVRGICRDLIGTVNASRAEVLSVDIPSGLDADTGKILGCCVQADSTVAFAAKKRGMILGAGAKVCGRVIVRDLGLPFRN